jgi:hypothetical protein
MLGADILERAAWAVLVEDHWRRLHWRIFAPTPDVLEDGSDGFVHGPKIGSVALAIKRYKNPCSGRHALKLLEYIADNRQIEHLFFFHTIGPNHDRGLMRDGIPALTNDPQRIAIRCNIVGFEVDFCEDLGAGGDGDVLV